MQQHITSELLSRALTPRAFEFLAELPVTVPEEFLLRQAFGVLPDETKH